MLNLLKEIQQETGTEDEDEVLLTAHCNVSENAQLPASNSNSQIDSRSAPSSLNAKMPSTRIFQVEANRKSTSSAGIQIGSNSTDDSSDISGYHSDSDTSPMSTQSPTSRTEQCTFQSPKNSNGKLFFFYFKEN